MIKKETCKLYRSFYEIIHPSISRKNISEYKIVFQDDMIPVQIFYPKKEAELNRILIYIQGNPTYPSYYEDLALETNHIVVFMDYSILNLKKDYWKVIKYIIEEAKKCQIDSKNISIMSDFHSTNIILNLEDKLCSKKYENINKILLSPTIHDLTEYRLKNTLILSNHEELIVSDKGDCNIIKESIYDFMNDKEMVSNEIIYARIVNFINGKEE